MVFFVHSFIYKFFYRSKRDTASDTAAREERVKDLEEKKQSLENELRIRQNDNEQFRRAVEKCREVVMQKRMDENSEKSQVNSLEAKQRDLKTSGSNSLQRYGHNMRNLVLEIDRLTNDNKFSRKPLGPLGSFISPKNMKYAIAIENCLGGLLFAFICNNHHDEQLVQKTMKKYNVRSSIITTKFMVYKLLLNILNDD